MATRNHTDDQRADTLTYHLTILTQAVNLAVAHLETLLKDPVSHARECRITEILHALDRVNAKAMHRGLGKSLPGITHEKHRVEEQVAQQHQKKPS